MSETYQYADCKHCGQSIMEGQIHNCKQMLLDEMEGLHKSLSAVCFERNLAQIEVHRLREALQKIEDCDECDPEISISLLQLIAREALADRP